MNTTTAVVLVVLAAIIGTAYVLGRVRTRKALQGPARKKVQEAYEAEKQARRVAAAARQIHQEAVERRKEAQRDAALQRETARNVPDAGLGDALDDELRK